MTKTYIKIKMKIENITKALKEQKFKILINANNTKQKC